MKAKIIGLQRKKVKLTFYKPEWEKLYEKEKKLLCDILGRDILDVQHVGSTSIRGAKSKPIIDIAIGIKSLRIGKKFLKSLKRSGYTFRGDAGVRGRLFFTKGNKKNRTHYLHIVIFNGRNWKNYLLFRDYLRRHKKSVREYNDLKEKLAKEFKNDRDMYTEKKNYFIKKVIKNANRNRNKI